MRSGREILHLPVVAISSGAKVGTVRDLVMDLDRQVVAALLLAEGSPQRPARLIPFESVRSVGPDAVTLEDESAVVVASERPRLQTLTESPVRVLGMKVLTEEGKLLGTVSDVMVDEGSGDIQQYEISGGTLHDLLSGRGYFPAAVPRVIGEQFMIVPEGATAAGRARVEEAAPLVVETPPWIGAEVSSLEIERVAAELAVRQEDLVVGMRARRTIANEDAGGVIVFEGETITRETVDRAKAAGKLNQLIHAASEPAAAALPRGMAGLYARVAVGRMAARTVHTPDGEIVVAQGDAVTPETVHRAREAGVLDQLMEAVRTPAAESEAWAARQRAARSLWDQVGERMGWLIGKR